MTPELLKSEADNCDAQSGLSPAPLLGGWRDLKTHTPPIRDFSKPKVKPYVLVVDSKGRMSIAYAFEYSSGEIGWTMAKPIGTVTHWMRLPKPPNVES